MPIPDEKARAWTRAEDYWPPRRLRRSARPAIQRFGGPVEEPRETRPFLDIVPYVVLMLGLGVLAVAIIVLAIPTRTATKTPPSEPVMVEVGTAPKGWIDEAEPARR